jgi:hypothetical protein
MEGMRESFLAYDTKPRDALGLLIAAVGDEQ